MEKFAYHGTGICTFVSIDGRKLMRLQDDDGSVIWYSAHDEGFLGDIEIEDMKPLEMTFRETVDLQVVDLPIGTFDSVVGDAEHATKH